MDIKPEANPVSLTIKSMVLQVSWDSNVSLTLDMCNLGCNEKTLATYYPLVRSWPKSTCSVPPEFCKLRNCTKMPWTFSCYRPSSLKSP